MVLSINPPLFPLSHSFFASALEKGLGRAMQHVLHYGSAGIDGLLIQHSLRCFMYDSQAEVSKAEWIGKMVHTAELDKKVLHAIASNTNTDVDENELDDLTHRCAILKELAQYGVEDARQLLYSFLSLITDSSEIIGGESIIALDGVEGFIHVVCTVGRWLEDNPNIWIDGRYTFALDESIGESLGRSILEREALTDTDIARYLAAEREMEKPLPPSPYHVHHTLRLSWTAAQVVEYASKKSTDSCRWFIQWGKHASPREHSLVFTTLLEKHNQQESQIVERLWWCFYRATIPHWDTQLMPWLIHPNHAIRYMVISGVASLRHPELRHLALEWIRSGDINHIEQSLRLLIGNFQQGDWQLCTEHLIVSDQSEMCHNISWSILDLFAKYHDAAACNALLFVYEHSPCSNCRQKAVQALYSLDIAPAWLREECLHDANPTIRELTQATTRNTSAA